MDTIEEIRDLVGSERKGEIVEGIPDLTEENEERNSDIRPKHDLSLVIKLLTEPGTEGFEAADSYLESVTQLRRTEAIALQKLDAFIDFTQPDEKDSTLDAVDGFIISIEELQEAESELDAARQDIEEFPGVLSLSGTPTEEIPKGRALSTKVFANNIGLENLNDLDFSTSSDLDISVQPSSIAELDPDEKKTLEVGTQDTGSSGQYRVSVKAEQNGGEEQHIFTLEIVGKMSYLEQAISRTEKILGRVQENPPEEGSGNQGGGRGRGGRGGSSGNQGLENKLEVIIDRLKDIKLRVEGGGGPSSNAIDNQIDSVINEFDAFKNQVRANYEEDSSVALLTRGAELTVEKLEKAKEAEV